MRKRMSPSFETAVWLYDIANSLLIVALVVGVFSTVLVVWMGKIKEEFLGRDLAQANEHIETLRAKNLEFEKAVSPRILEQNLTAQKLKPFSDISVIVVSPSDFEPKRTAGQIRYMLAQAGWKRLSGSPDKKVFLFFDG